VSFPVPYFQCLKALTFFVAISVQGSAVYGMDEVEQCGTRGKLKRVAVHTVHEIHWGRLGRPVSMHPEIIPLPLLDLCLGLVNSPS
jgi:hypothetical protein